LTPADPVTKICWLTANPNGVAEVVKVTLKPKQRLKTLQFDVDFSELAIKGRGAMGNIVTRNEAHRFTLKKEGVSTLGGRDVWYDPDVNRLNYEGRGRYLGEFNSEDSVLVITTNGEYYTSTFDASNHYPDNILRIEKYVPHKAWTAILNDADQGYPYLKRFTFEPTSKPQRYLGENEKSTLLLLSDEPGLRVEVTYAGADAVRPPLEVTARDFVAVKSYKAKGKRLTTYAIDHITELEPVELPGVDDDEESPQTGDEGESSPAEYVERSDDEVRDEITGQTRLFE
ncbi:MAG: DNA gyrase/topoisomerase IV subunit A, partial [Duncaniella sp.]|nr:DNA gyrase/topoisomerase IV subunit A [Duncaniella sp.]